MASRSEASAAGEAGSTPNDSGGRRVFVWTDHHADGRKAAAKICKSLQGVAAAVFLVDAEPDLHDNSDVVDVFLHEREIGGENGAAAVLKALAANTPLFGTTTLQDIDLALLGGAIGETLLDLNVPATPDVIGVFRDPSLVLLTGDSGSGKSLISAYIAAVRITSGETVLWVDADRQGRRRCAARVLGMLNVLIGEEAARRSFIEGMLVYVESLGGTAERRAEASKLVRVVKPGLIVIDALVSAAGEEEVAEGDNSGLRVRFEQRILHGVCAAADGPPPLIVLLGHLGKGIDAKDRHARGWSAALDMVDQHVRVRKRADATTDGETGEYDLESYKDRDGYWRQDGKCIATFTVVRSDDDRWIEVDRRPLRADRDTGVADDRLEKAMVEISLWLEARDEPVTRTEVKREVGGNSELLTSALDALKAAGYIDSKPGSGSRSNARLTWSVRPYRRTTPVEPARRSRGSAAVLGGSENRDESAVPAVPPLYKGELGNDDGLHQISGMIAPSFQGGPDEDPRTETAPIGDRCRLCGGPVNLTPWGSPICAAACGARAMP